MSRNFGIISKRAEYERKRTLNPKLIDPPIGDWPRDPRDTFQPIPQDKWLPKLILYLLITLILFVGWTFLVVAAFSRDLDGRYANNPLHGWFNQLSSGKGNCCSNADGITVEDVDWTVQREGQICQKVEGDGADYVGHYCVRLLHEWWLVPDKAVITEPNKAGGTVVWPVYATINNNGVQSQILHDIRCFLRGVEG